MNDWDVIIIGAGLSGLGAGIRLAIANKKVLMIEQHSVVGGLNSFFVKNGILYDVGLHAMTNFVPRGAPHHPLTQLCRQLRIPYDALQLEEQRASKIQFPGVTLTFTNQFEHLLSDVRTYFPQEIDGLLKLDTAVMAYDDRTLESTPFISTCKTLSQWIHDPLLQNMLLLPLLYYGSAHTDDIDWRQFCTLYKAIYKEGFARPKGGIRPLLKLLVQQYHTYGGVLRLKTPIQSIVLEGNKATGVLLQSGEILYAHCILSSAGYFETQALASSVTKTPQPTLSFVETITVYPQPPQALGLDTTICFFNQQSTIHYRTPESLIDLTSGVICIPENYGTHPAQQTTLRTTHLANYAAWKRLSPSDYAINKQSCLKQSRAHAFELSQGKEPSSVLGEDVFTPLTIERFTGHHQGAIYGSPDKRYNGSSGYENLYLCGTDQGFLGIVGALLSGISIANYRCLKG